MAPEPPSEADPRIGTLNEKPLHAALKAWYARDGDRPEARVDGFVVDLLRPRPEPSSDALLIEIQTGRLGTIRPKLERLLAHHSVRVVTPIPAEKWLVKLAPRNGPPQKRRKSPKRGTRIDAFREWVSIAPLIGHPNLSLDILLIQEEEVRRFDGRRGWRRRGWVIEERRLLGVRERHPIDTLASLRELLPETLPRRFTTADLASGLAVSRGLAQKMAYVMRECGAIDALSRNRSGILYGWPHD